MNIFPFLLLLGLQLNNFSGFFLLNVSNLFFNAIYLGDLADDSGIIDVSVSKRSKKKAQPAVMTAAKTTSKEATAPKPSTKTAAKSKRPGRKTRQHPCVAGMSKELIKKTSRMATAEGPVTSAIHLQIFRDPFFRRIEDLPVAKADAPQEGFIFSHIFVHSKADARITIKAIKQKNIAIGYESTFLSHILT